MSGQKRWACRVPLVAGLYLVTILLSVVVADALSSDKDLILQFPPASSSSGATSGGSSGNSVTPSPEGLAVSVDGSTENSGGTTKNNNKNQQELSSMVSYAAIGHTDLGFGFQDGGAISLSLKVSFVVPAVPDMESVLWEVDKKTKLEAEEKRRLKEAGSRSSSSSSSSSSQSLNETTAAPSTEAATSSRSLPSQESSNGTDDGATSNNVTYTPLPQRYALMLKVLPASRWATLKKMQTKQDITPQRACFYPAVAERYLPLDKPKFREMINATSIKADGGSTAQHLYYSMGAEFQVEFRLPSDGMFIPVLFLCDIKGVAGGVSSPMSDSRIQPLSDPFVASASVSYTYTNPGGVGIPLQDIPLLEVFVGFSFIYLAILLLSAGWLLNQRYRRKKKVYKIQVYHIVAVVFRLLNTTMSTLENYLLQTTQIDPKEGWIIFVRNITLIVSDVCFIAVQLMLCRGLSYIYLQLSTRDRQIIAGCCAFYAVTLALVTFSEGESRNQSQAYQFAATLGRFATTLVAYFSVLFTVDKARKLMLIGESRTEAQSMEEAEEEAERRDAMNRASQLEAAADQEATPSGGGGGGARGLNSSTSGAGSSLDAEALEQKALTDGGLLHAYLRLNAFTQPYSFYVIVPLLIVLVDYTLLSWHNQYIEAMLSESSSVYYCLIVMYFFREQAIV